MAFVLRSGPCIDDIRHTPYIIYYYGIRSGKNTFFILAIRRLTKIFVTFFFSKNAHLTNINAINNLGSKKMDKNRRKKSQDEYKNKENGKMLYNSEFR